MKDLSKKQFLAKLEKYNLAYNGLWIEEKKPERGMGIGVVSVKRNGEWQVHYRSSLARALKELKL